MGLPTLRGTFVGGDDHHLALNHVYVNHPSLTHAVKLFGIVHRDLYQPLPLLTFQLEFALANAIGLFDRGVEGGAWLFHLTNIILHAANAILVWVVVKKLQEGILHKLPLDARVIEGRGFTWDSGGSAVATATVAGLLFAVHPLQTEVVAWTNGRMMLLSTLFALLSLLSFASWLDKPGQRSAILTVIFALLTGISKVRTGLPVLLAVVFLARRARLTRGAIVLWLISSMVTGIFVLVNIKATAGAALFTEAAEHLQGPRTVRVLLALGFYFQHIVWPTGLASYYPTPPLVRWSDAETLTALLIVVPTVVVIAWACRRSRVAMLGMIWFFVTLGETLPFFPARNVLAADRYLYLPIIGAFWPLAAVAVTLHRQWFVARSALLGRIAATAVGLAVIPACVAVSWHTAYYYDTALLKTTRIAALFPDTPRVWERVGWSYHKLGRYAEAMECASKELEHESPDVQSGGYQLLGLCQLNLGNGQKALELLQKAVEVDPDNALGKYRLAFAYGELGRTEEALPYYEAAIQKAAGQNPTIIRLAGAYRKLGRPADARKMYEKAVENNPFDVSAAVGLVELDLAEGTREAHLAAERRLLKLLDTLSENAIVLTNLGVVRVALGQTHAAIEAYTHALANDPGNVTAAVNLAQLYSRASDVQRARALFERAAAGLLDSADQAVAIHDFYVLQGEVGKAVQLWQRVIEMFPQSPQARVFAAWARALAGDFAGAEVDVTAIADLQSQPPLVLAVQAYVALARGQYEAAIAHADDLCGTRERGADARRRLLGALERFEQQRPDVPWTICIAARLLIAEGNIEAARVFVGLCQERCMDPLCLELVDALRVALPP
jgi:tetratricopeptide (TPR) repeat protein